MLEQLGSSTTVVDHSNLLEVGSRIRVIGDPGAGKSSLVKRLMRDACRLAQATPKKARLPVLIELKKCKVPGNAPKDIGAWFLAELKKEALKSDVYRMDECFDAYVRGSGLLVLLDGLDEVASAEYQKVQAAIAGLSQTLGKLSDKNAIVLTMRTQFHMQVKDAFRDSFGHVVALRPFTPSNIYEFLKRWDFGANQREQVNRVYKQLTDRPSLREMCSNPLVLSMYVASDQEKRNLVAPESRTEFYKKVTEELMIKRRLAQTGAVAASFTLIFNGQ
jgi:predicted NACHT family NTPase